MIGISESTISKASLGKFFNFPICSWGSRFALLIRECKTFRGRLWLRLCMGCTFLRLASAAFRMQFCCNDASCSGMRYQVIAALNCLILNTVLASIRASRYCKGPWKMRLIIRWLESPFYFLSIPSLPATTIRIRESFLLFFRVSMNCQWKN